jgi:hypothetical protein
MSIAVACRLSRKTHLLAIPLLAAPTAACRVNDAGAASTATRILCHVKLLMDNRFVFGLTFICQAIRAGFSLNYCEMTGQGAMFE